MTLSNLWAYFCALLRPKGAINLDSLVNANLGAATTAVVLGASAGALGSAVAAMVPVPDGALVLGDQSATAGLVADAAALAPVAPVAPVAPAPAPAAAPAAALVAPAALDPVDPDDDAEDRDELESLSALAGDGDLFVASLKNLVSFAMDLGHDFETAFDAAAARVKTMFAAKQ